MNKEQYLLFQKYIVFLVRKSTLLSILCCKKGVWVIRPPAPGPYKSFNKLNLLLVKKSSHYDHVHITFNGLRVI